VCGSLGRAVRFRLRLNRFEAECECFVPMWVLPSLRVRRIIEVRTRVWNPYRSRVGASRLRQASGRPAYLNGSQAAARFDGSVALALLVLSGPAAFRSQFADRIG